MFKKPLISIIISNYNGAKYIRKCLKSILDSNFSNFEVIFIDDGSTDKSRNVLEEFENNSKIKIIYLKKNIGLSQARNKGVLLARGKYLFFLDIDTEIEKNCLTVILKKFESDADTGAVQAKLIKERGELIETAGHFLSLFGLPYEIGTEEKKDQYKKEVLIFGARNAAMALRKTLFEKVGGFDEDYFIYGEDTDLSWRIWLFGYKIYFLPKAVVYHFTKSSLSKKNQYKIFYQGAKNNTMNLLKNAEPANLFWMLILEILTWIVISLKLIIQGRFVMAGWIYKGLYWNIKNLKKILKKRKFTASFTIKDNQVDKIMFNPFNKNKLSLDFSIFLKGLKWFLQV